MTKNSIQISSKVFDKMMYYAHISSGEISGFAALDKNNIISILYPLLDQECSLGETTLDTEALLDFTKNNKLVNVWWHSHANMGVFWSGVDENTINNLGQVLSWLLSIVVNKERQVKVRIDYFNPIHITADIEIELVGALSEKEREQMREEVKTKVTVPSAITVVHSYFPENREFAWDKRAEDAESRQFPTIDEVLERQREKQGLYETPHNLKVSLEKAEYTLNKAGWKTVNGVILKMSKKERRKWKGLQEQLKDNQTNTEMTYGD